MDADAVAKVFDLFEQVVSTLGRDKHGRGSGVEWFIRTTSSSADWRISSDSRAFARLTGTMKLIACRPLSGGRNVVNSGAERATQSVSRLRTWVVIDIEAVLHQGIQNYCDVHVFGRPVYRVNQHTALIVGERVQLVLLVL